MHKTKELTELMKSKEDRQNMAMAISVMKESEGWKYLSLYLETQMEELQVLINDTSITSGNVTEKAFTNWQLKVKRKGIEDLIELPLSLISILVGSASSTEVENDPF